MADNSSLHLAVVGGGPGGYAAAFLAGDLGLELDVIDERVEDAARAAQFQSRIDAEERIANLVADSIVPRLVADIEQLVDSLEVRVDRPHADQRAGNRVRCPANRARQSRTFERGARLPTKSDREP